MKKEEILQKTMDYIKTLINNDDSVRLDQQTPILSGRIVDSLGVINLVAFIETQFGIQVEQQDLSMDNLDSADKIANYLFKKIHE